MKTCQVSPALRCLNRSHGHETRNFRLSWKPVRSHQRLCCLNCPHGYGTRNVRFLRRPDRFHPRLSCPNRSHGYGTKSVRLSWKPVRSKQLWCYSNRSQGRVIRNVRLNRRPDRFNPLRPNRSCGHETWYVILSRKPVRSCHEFLTLSTLLIVSIVPNCTPLSRAIWIISSRISLNTSSLPWVSSRLWNTLRVEWSGAFWSNANPTKNFAGIFSLINISTSRSDRWYK